MDKDTIMAEWTYTRITPKIEEAEGKYHGIVDTLPTSNLIRGDSCTARENGALVIKAWNGYRWVNLAESNFSNAEQSVICGKAQKDVLEAVESGTVTSSEYGYFRSLIAGVVSADYIKALEGVFSNIIVTGDSYFYGHFDCPTIESLPNQSGESYTKVIPSNTSSSSSTQYDAMESLWTEAGLLLDVNYPITLSGNIPSGYSQVSFVRKVVAPVMTIFYFSSSSSTVFNISKYTDRTPAYYVGTSATFTLNMSFSTGDILKFKGLQDNKVGLKENQIYYTVMNGHKVLCLV